MKLEKKFLCKETRISELDTCLQLELKTKKVWMEFHWNRIIFAQQTRNDASDQVKIENKATCIRPLDFDKISIHSRYFLFSNSIALPFFFFFLLSNVVNSNECHSLHNCEWVNRNRVRFRTIYLFHILFRFNE